jgi:AmmeMemoRadiSam system protein B
VYSGQVAGTVFSRLEIPASCIVLCPNHTGRGHPLAIMKEGGWRTPLGTLPIDSALAERLMEVFPALAEDDEAHRFEHAIEVELPFLQVLRQDVTIVPIAVGTARPVTLHELGKSLAALIEANNTPVLLIASSDMNHYEDDATTRMKDHKAIDQILALDPRGLHETVITESISMCGFAPTIAMLTAAKLLGADKTELVQYATSGDVSGDRDRVVGYAGIIIQ